MSQPPYLPQPYKPYPVQPPPYAPQPRLMPTAPPKSPGVAALMSLLVPGLGHIYSGKPLVAIAWFITAVIVGILSFGLGLFIVSPLAMIHAHASTTSYNRRHNAIL